MMGEAEEEEDIINTEEFSGEVEFDNRELMQEREFNGSTGFHTTRVNGNVGKRTLHILIDSGSTHNCFGCNSC